MNILLNAGYAFIATMSFCILFQCPKKAIVSAGFCGMLAWTVYTLVFIPFESVIVATFAGAFATGLASQIIARMPITITLMPGIIPLVPGAGMYFTMLYLLQGNYEQAIYKGTETMLIALAIANAVIITATIYKIILSIKIIKK